MLSFHDEESTRLRLLRAISVVIGTVLAALLSIDAAQLLDYAIPDVSQAINIFYIDIPKLIHGINPFISGEPAENLPGMITPGIILTGLAASAGSAFWHDQLDRLQEAKKGAEMGARLLKEIKGGKGEE